MSSSPVTLPCAIEDAVVAETVKYLAHSFTDMDGSGWIAQARDLVRRAHRCGGGVSALLVGQSASVDGAMRLLAECTRGEHDRFAFYVRMLHALSGIEFSIYAEKAALIVAQPPSAARVEGAAEFAREVSHAIDFTCAQTENLRARSAAAASLARDALARRPPK